MNELLFHSSWWLLACVAAGGIAIFVAGNRRLDKNFQRVGIAIVAVAAILGLLRFCFPTARERMENRTRQIVHAFDKSDWDGMTRLLDPDTAVCNRSSVLIGGKDEIIAYAKATRDRVKSIMILGEDSAQTDTLIKVSLNIYCDEVTQDRPITSEWEFEYEQSGKNWLLTKITVLRVGSETPNPDFNPQLPNY
jgi:hypothetical protein